MKQELVGSQPHDPRAHGKGEEITALAADADDDGSMDGAVDDDGSIGREAIDDEVRTGMPLQGSCIGGVDPTSSTHIDTHEQTSTPMHKHTPSADTAGDIDTHEQTSTPMH